MGYKIEMGNDLASASKAGILSGHRPLPQFPPQSVAAVCDRQAFQKAKADGL
jgi:hypothetical protein